MILRPAPFAGLPSAEYLTEMDSFFDPNSTEYAIELTIYRLFLYGTGGIWVGVES